MTLTLASNKCTDWQRHKKAWQSCQRCPLHQTRHNVCLIRGRIPADILFIGEAPGESEDTLGEPFVGPAGRLLEEIIKDACRRVYSSSVIASIGDGPDTPMTLTRIPPYAITNILGCIPHDEVGNIRPPTKQEAAACKPRLLEIIHIVEPKLIITLGQKAKQYLAIPSPIKVGHLIHPAAILRNQGPKGELDYKRAVLTLSRLLGEL